MLQFKQDMWHSKQMGNILPWMSWDVLEAVMMTTMMTMSMMTTTTMIMMMMDSSYTINRLDLTAAGSQYSGA